MANVVQRVFDLIKDTVEACGVTLWNVTFVKEGASHYLRVYIDRSEGVTIDDCTDVSHAIDPIIDQADPIDCSYYLEVCSPGLDRELSRDEHFTAMIGKEVTVKLFKSLNGTKEISGKLEAYDGGVTLMTGDGEIRISRSDIAKANLKDL